MSRFLIAAAIIATFTATVSAAAPSNTVATTITGYTSCPSHECSVATGVRL